MTKTAGEVLAELAVKFNLAQPFHEMAANFKKREKWIDDAEDWLEHRAIEDEARASMTAMNVPRTFRIGRK